MTRKDKDMSNSNSKKKAADDVEEIGDAAVDAGKSAAASIQDRASEVAGTVRDAVAQAGRSVGDSYQRLSDNARDSYQSGRDKVLDFESNMETRIQDSPFSAVLIGVGIGFVFGFLFRGNRRS